MWPVSYRVQPRHYLSGSRYCLITSAAAGKLVFNFDCGPDVTTFDRKSRSYFGFIVDSSATTRSTQWQYLRVEVPFWMLIPLTAVPLLVRIFLHLRAGDRFKAGHCPSCGYDLTGLPGAACPECGSEPPQPKTA